MENVSDSILNPVALFLFAHQDDECGVLHAIHIEKDKGRRVVCIYLTDGGHSAASATRNNESLNVLHRIGVCSSDVFFLGDETGIKDMFLYKSLIIAYYAIRNCLSGNSYKIEIVYTPVLEGGHPDHDSTNIIARRLVTSLEPKCELLQFSLYHANGCIGPFFKVFSPLKSNGMVDRIRIPLTKRLLYVRLCLLYYSQWRTWIGLLPFVAFHYIFVGDQLLQRAADMSVKPHSGVLYYEKRGFAKLSELKKSFDEFMVMPLK